MAGPDLEGLVKSFQLDSGASADLLKNRFVVLVSEHTIKMCDTDGALCIGVSGLPITQVQRDRGNSGGPTTDVQMDGIPLVEAGASFSLGDKIAADSVGRAITATTADVILGIAMKAAAAAGDWVPIWLVDPITTA